MRADGRRGLALVAAIACGLCAASPAAAHEAGAARARDCAERPVIRAEQTDAALGRARARLGGMARPENLELFPIEPYPLLPGSPSRVRVRGLPRAVFAIGADEASVAWLAANADRLRAENAQGLLVAAKSEDSLRRMRAFAARLGLTLDPMPGGALATAFGAVSYPFVAEPSK